MKNNITRAAVMLLLTFMASATAWADPDLVIRSAADWNTFADNVNNGTSYQGQTVVLAADISVTTMVGINTQPFDGTFDGCGHTLNLNLTNGGYYTAPFSKIQGATIKNLKTTGTVTGGMHCSGLVGIAFLTNLIQNCEVAVSVVCSGGNHSHCGGIVGHGGDSNTTIRDCLFSGSIEGATQKTGIIYGWANNGTHTLINCLAAGTYINCGGLDIIQPRGTVNVSNCYKTQNVGNYGTYTTATGETLRALLGDGWEVSGNNVVPVMVNSFEVPNVSYFAYNTTTQTFETLTANVCRIVTSSTTTMGVANTETWYVVNNTVTVNSSRIEVLGTVNLILADGKTFRAEKGLHVPDGVTLNIYGQSSGTGKLFCASEADYLAGIGGNNDETSGTINIHSGRIEAYGNYLSAAIGGGRAANGGTTTIYGGTVNATGGTYGAGIGGGANGNGGTITIIGGTVIAQAGTVDGNDNSQAIGSGAIGSGGTLMLGDMKVYASAEATNPVTYANRVSTCHSKYAKLVPCTDHNYVNGVCNYCGAMPNVPVTYLAYQTTTHTFAEQTVSETTLVDEFTTTMGADNTETWYAVRRGVSNDNRIEVRGTVHLILCDGKTLTASKGITVNNGNTLIIYGQSGGTGALNATGFEAGGNIYECAAIGSTGRTSLGDITIHGGRITATGVAWTAGIGGGIGSGEGSITIYGGTINATGNSGNSEAIGHGADGANVTRTLIDGLRVTTGSNTTPVAYSDRLSGLSQKVARVEPCTEHHTTTDHCDYCGITCYAVAYDGNNATNGTVPVPNTTYLPGATVTVLGNTANLERTGYTFAGWNTKANGSGTTYTAGATFTINGTTTLYAKWAPITYTVRFHKNHDDATGTMSDLTLTYDVAQPLTTNAFIRNGYALVGWSTIANGTVAYTDGQSVSNLATEQNVVVNLYAQWTELYTIGYDLAGGSVATPNPTTYTVLSNAITLVNPTREGYTFTGWTGTGLTEPTMTVTIPAGSTGNREYTATWIMTSMTLRNTADNSAIIAEANEKLLESVTLADRTLYRNGDWNTLVLPFNLNSLTGTPLQRFKLKTLSSSTYSDGTLTMNFADASTIEAGKPYIVRYEEADLVISSTADWNSFVNKVKNGTTYQGKIVKLAADITISQEVGTYNKFFKGTFDGGGHTLTLNITYTNANSCLGPFRYIEGATIKNLFVDGTITSMGHGISGLVGSSRGTVTISNCVVSASITSTMSNDEGRNGGFVGEIRTGSVTINNCAFNGRLLGPNCTTNGGFIGDKYDSSYPAVFNNCLFAPSQVTMGSSNSGTYINTKYNNPVNTTFNNSYYKTQFGSKQGTKTTYTGTALKNQLGNGWEVVNGDVVPKMERTPSNIVNPVFTNVTINEATTNVSTTYADFIGSYAPFNNDALLLDALNPNGDAQHAALNITAPTAPTGFTFGGWYSDAELTAPVTTIPFATNGTVTLYAKWIPTLTVAGYGTGTDKWVFIASPVAGSIAPDDVVNLLGSQISENPVLYNYDLYRFNQSPAMSNDGRYLEWENYHQHNTQQDPFLLVNGQGYLYARQNNVNLFFNGTLNTGNVMSVNLDYDGSARLKGYNLVGNPFPCEAYVNRPFYRMNDAGNNIEPVANYDSYTPTTIPPYTGIIVKADGANESVTFSTSAPATSTGNHGNLAITLSQQTETTRGSSTTVTHDKAFVSFNEGSRLGKFYFGEQNGNIYIPQGGEEYAIVSVGGRDAMHCVSTEIPVNFKATKDGTYTLTVNPEETEMAYLHLIDNLTGTNVDLLQTPSYTFEGKTTDYASRFKLVFSARKSIEEIGDEGFAFIHDGEIIIEADGIIQVIDMLGRVLVNRDANERITTDGLVGGVYVLRLINGEIVKTQKIVVK
ncbi:MAG: InlB B-repeat-containing protein [Bacteroidales bacterium]|nr:InlB B-repeat-containing protein [Bacteroidales bacterium]